MRCATDGPAALPAVKSAPTTVPLATLLCLVVAISDGDTLTARCGTPGTYEQVKVRVAAIDAPESRQAFGQMSRQNLARLCFRQRAALQPVDEDSYGRTVANVRCGSTDVATAQVRAGLAWVYTPYASAHPHLVPLQSQARSGGTGLWSQRRPQAPWDYRHRRSRH
ncbi:thermonuclease family protein [Acidovorax sp. LjRoot194]|uniref:thermonuclease family protein n=1 Tax=Acidovorax sp. LjRoot194 TaxID=3342280 RepID=UPI003ECCE39C